MHSSRVARAAVLAALALLPSCTLFGPCDDGVFDLLATLNQSFPNSTRGIPIFVDPCPLFPTDCGDTPPPFPFGPRCGLDSTDACACFGGDFVTTGGQSVERAVINQYGNPSDIVFSLGAALAGISPAIKVSATLAEDHLQTFQLAVEFPDAFTFNGFTALGPADTQVGVYALDIDRDGIVEIGLPLRARSFDGAYVDLNRNGRFDDGVDGTVTHTVGSHVFTTELPLGGDGNASLYFGPLTMRVTAALYAGILTNGDAGMYQVTATFRSVDPDSGGADNAVGQESMSFAPDPQQLAIAPSPIDGLDPFLCYKSKQTKGTVCGPGSGAAYGAGCAAEEDCGGTTGSTTLCRKNVLPKGTHALIENAIEAVDLELKKPATLCAPAGENGTVVEDELTHFRGYRVKPVKTSCVAGAIQNANRSCATSADCGGSACVKTPKHVPVRGIQMVNALGTVIVDTVKPDTLLFPSAKGLIEPAMALPEPTLDHFRCYTVRLRKKVCAENPNRACKRNADCDVDGPCLLKFPKGIQASVQDQFNATPRLLDVKKPTRLCVAAERDDEGIENPAQNFLCYKVKPAKGSSAHVKRLGVHLTHDFGRERVDTAKEDELCVPSVRTQ